MATRTEKTLDDSICILGGEMGGVMRRALTKKINYTVFYKTSWRFEEMGSVDFSGTPISLCNAIIFRHFRKYASEHAQT
jgi:hypothetical protein